MAQRERLASLMGKGKNDEEQVDIFQDLKSKVQPSQDNCDPMVKKLEKGATVTCYKCHGEGHKFYKCPPFVKKMDKGTKKKLNLTIKSSLIYTKPNRKNKTKSNTYVIKKKANGKVIAHKVGKMKEEQGWNQPIWVPKEVITNMKGLKWFGFQRPLEGLECGDLGGLAQRSCEDSRLEAKLASWTCVAHVPRFR
jgi:hypothetical protein